MPDTSEILAQADRFIPPYWQAYAPVVAGMAATFARGWQSAEEMLGSVSIDGASDVFLTLLARGYGLYRASGESDDSLRFRLRNVERKVTRPAILERVDAILDPYTDIPAEMFEHFESGAFCDQDFADQTTLYDQHNAFTIVVPRIGDDDRVSAYADVDFADDAFAGPGNTNTAYIAVMAEVERIRAAGIRWWLQIAEEEDLRVSIEVTLHLGHLPATPQEWPFWVPDGFRLTRVGTRPSIAVVGGTLGLYKCADGEEAASGVDQFEAGPITLTGDTANVDVDRTGDLKVLTDDRDSADDGSWWILVGTNIDISATSENVAVALTFDPVN